MKTLEFKTLDGRSFKGHVKDGSRPVHAVAAKLAAKVGIAGCFQLLDEENPDIVLDPSTTLHDLPSAVVMVPELTPAC